MSIRLEIGKKMNRCLTSPNQFEMMVSFMERNGDIMKPTTSGPRGKLRNGELWDELTTALNSEGSGGNRTAEKWKKVWSDLKNNTKRKAAKIYKEATRTGGGPACQITLSDLEERVMTIIGIRSAVGLPNPEIGFEAEIIQEVQPPEPQPSSLQVESMAFSQEPSFLVDSDEIFGPMVIIGDASVPAPEISPALPTTPPAQPPLTAPPARSAEPVPGTSRGVHPTPPAQAPITAQPARLAEPVPGTSRAVHPTPPSQAPLMAPPVRSAEPVPGTSRTLFPPVTPRSLRRRGAIGSPPGQLRRRMRQQVSHLEAATNQFVRSDAEWREQMNERERRAEERERRAEEREARAEERQLRALQLEAGWQRLFERLVAVAEKFADKF